MSKRQCPSGCDAEPPRGVILCRACKNKLVGYLADCESLRQELVITLTHQDRIGPESEGRSAETPLAYNVAASESLDALKATLVSWVLLVADETKAALPADKIAALSSWLSVRINYLVRHEAAGELFDEMRALNLRCTATINLPRDRSRIHVGPCPEFEPSDDADAVNGMTPCPGEVTAFFPTDPDLRPVMMCLHEGCTHGEKIWPAEQWTRLGTRILAKKGVKVTWEPVSMQRMAAAIA
jgi:hypothetical protein